VAPKVATLTLTHGASSLDLPVRAGRTRPSSDPLFPIPTHRSDESAPGGRTPLRQTGPDADGWYEILDEPQPFSYPVADTGTVISGAMGIEERLRIQQGDNNSCVWQGERSGGFQRGDWNCTVYSSFRLTSTAEAFFIEETLRATDGGEVVFERENKASVPRDLI
jgi:hypothetical protein